MLPMNSSIYHACLFLLSSKKIYEQKPAAYWVIDRIKGSIQIKENNVLVEIFLPIKHK